MASVAGPLLAQASPGSPASRRPVEELVDKARRFLQKEDATRALTAFAAVCALAPADHSGQMGLAETWLFLGRPGLAARYIESVRRADPDRQDAIALHVRILIRAAEFDRAVRMSTRALDRHEKPTVELLAAHGSALFRVQRTVDASAIYQRVLSLDPLHAEAHLRLGSGLLTPRDAPYDISVLRGIRALEADESDEAVAHFRDALRNHPGHPVAHRLLGETLYRQRHAKSIASQAPCYRDLRAAMPTPGISDLPWRMFVPAYRDLDEERRKVVARSLSLFRHLIPKLVVMRGKHDILRADERTTDAVARAKLKGKRTFDGRVWDDVRGIGGLHAATGIEALDEALHFEFNTLSHEIAHQAHLYAFTPLLKAKVKRLYRNAKREGRCLDFYAATNNAEYFGQGVEAFVSLGKRPGCEKTHGHTRFELRRVDRELYDFIERVVRHDPLSTVEGRARILPLAVEVALRSGNPDDALEAASMMDAGPERTRLTKRARRAQLLMRTF